MREHIVKFVDKNTDIATFARVYGNEIKIETIDRIRTAITNYKKENEGEWDTEGCFEVIQEQLKDEGYEFWLLSEELEISF